MPFVFQDFETQSNIDLPVTGTMRYVLDPSTRALLDSGTGSVEYPSSLG